MARTGYLQRRTNSQFWHVRLMVPRDVRQALGRAEFTKSLGVTDKQRAKVLSLDILSGWHREIENARSGFKQQLTGAAFRAATEQEIDAHLAEHSYERMRRMYGSFSRSDIKDGSSTFKEEQDELKKRIEYLQERVFLREHLTYIDLLESELNDRGLTLPSDPGVRDGIARKVVMCLIDATTNILFQMQGKEESHQPSDFIASAKSSASNAEPQHHTIMAIFEKYASQRLSEGSKRQDSIDQDRIIVTQFSDFVGEARSLASVTRNEVREWRDTIAKLPRSYKNINAYKNLDIRSAAKKASDEGAKPISPVSQNKYLSTVSPLYRWAIRNGYVETNPCDGLHLDINKSGNSYPGYTAVELSKIVCSPLFTGFQKDGAEHKPGSTEADDWRYWIPLICLFTGARIGEVAQLRIADVRDMNGRFMIHIRNDNKTGQRTKSGKGRIVPVHRYLEQAGFLHFISRQRDTDRGQSGMLFPELKSNERDHIGAIPSRFWRRYLGKIGMKDGADGYGAHSFRHTMADELRAAGFLDDQFGPLILGHSKGGVTATYGRLPQGTADMLCAMIDAVDFKGVDFGPLIKRASGVPWATPVISGAGDGL